MDSHNDPRKHKTATAQPQPLGKLGQTALFLQHAGLFGELACDFLGAALDILRIVLPYVELEDSVADLFASRKLEELPDQMQVRGPV